MSKSASTSSVYRVSKIIGTSESSWEDAAKHAVETATKTLRDLRVAEVSKLDLVIVDGQSHRFPRAGESVVQVRRERLGLTGEEGGYRTKGPTADDGVLLKAPPTRCGGGFLHRHSARTALRGLLKLCAVGTEEQPEKKS